MNRSTRISMAVIMFLATAAPCLAENNDPFAKGITLEGTRALTASDGRIAEQNKWTLRITERIGNAFRGEVNFDINTEERVYPVEGVATDGYVAFKGKTGKWNQQFVGKFTNGEVRLDFSGRGPLGASVHGIAFLAPKANDPFAKGITLEGTRALTASDGRIAEPNKWTLRITERIGNAFKGEVNFDINTKERVYPVEGVATDGYVAFKGKTGKWNQQFVGKFTNGEVRLDFSGRGPLGASVHGIAFLAP